MDPQQATEYIVKYVQQGANRNEMARLFPLAVQAASRRGAAIYSNIDATKDIFAYVANIAERGETTPGSCANTEAAIRVSVGILLLLFGEDSATRKKLLTGGMERLRATFPLPDPYKVPYIEQVARETRSETEEP